jgi:hypothetical protein
MFTDQQLDTLIKVLQPGDDDVIVRAPGGECLIFSPTGKLAILANGDLLAIGGDLPF